MHKSKETCFIGYGVNKLYTLWDMASERKLEGLSYIVILHVLFISYPNHSTLYASKVELALCLFYTVCSNLASTLLYSRPLSLDQNYRLKEV